MNRLFVKITLIVVSAMVVVSGCGGSSKKAAPAATTLGAGATPGAAAVNATVPLPKPACEFLSGDDITAALGNPVSGATPAGDTNCTWGTTVDGGTSLDLTVVKAAAGASGEACKDQRNTLSRGVAKESVSGVGDSAVWFVEQLTTIKQGHLLACWDNGVVVVLLTGEKDADALKTTASGLANKVHSRLT
ncbi:MAG: hypothetical protein M3011_11820 [Actinomycetota bacterium]|nr:hypothetical protein [Actinomycetota bacterium]